MARNYEKNFGQLNRWWLSQGDKSKKHPKRPRLADLNTVEEIRKWLPNVKEEIEFCLSQSQVPCYTNDKVKEYHKKVLKLEVEYKRMLKKAKTLDSKAVINDGILRPYERKRSVDLSQASVSHISLPVLQQPGNQPHDPSNEVSISTSAFQNSDSPLQFEPRSINIMKPNDEAHSNAKINILGLTYSSSDDET